MSGLTNQPNPDKLQFAFNPGPYVNAVYGNGASQTISLAGMLSGGSVLYDYINFSPDGGSCYVNFNGHAAAKPGANVTNGQGSVCNPSGRYVGAILATALAAGLTPSITVFAAAGVVVTLECSKS